MNFIYQEIDSGIKICTSDVYKSFRSIEIPSEINKMPVVEIDDMAFTGCTNLQEIKLSQNLRRIGKFAFFGCSSLRHIYLPKSIEFIDNYAFRDCDKLESIELSDWVRKGDCILPPQTICYVYKFQDQERKFDGAITKIAEEMRVDVSGEFRDALLRLLDDNREPLFLTGAAGTGKTTLLNCFLKIFRCLHPCEKVLKCATTGIAANLLDGRTIHSLFRFKPGDYHPISHLIESEDPIQYYKNVNFYKTVRVLVIDEVSMLKPDLVDAIDEALRRLKQQSDIPFGGVKIIFVGDLGQLPPIYTQNRDRYEKDYGSSAPYFFDAKVLETYKKRINKFVISLKKVRRQKDYSFIEALTHLRSGDLTEKDVCLFSSCYNENNDKTPLLERTTIYPLKKDVNDLNLACLNQLDGDEKQFIGVFTYHVKKETDPRLFDLSKKKEREIKEDKCKYQYNLRLKKGARVMLLKNSQKDGYNNGSCGVIDSFGGEDSIPYINVRLLESHRSVKIFQEKEEYVESKCVNGKEESFRYASFFQFPLRLAWAITIHKSQGQTHDEVFMDVSKSFECGQVYTAFSRIKTLNGLRLLRPFSTKGIYVDSRVKPFL